MSGVRGTKALDVRPVDRATANAFVRRWHVSRTFVHNSQAHLGVFLHGGLVGVLQFGPPLDRRKLLPLVAGSRWPDVLELNRLAFTDDAPRCSESRALAVALRLLRRHAPQVKWVVTFADATRSGDGAIYRAAGFLLTGVRRNTTVWELAGEHFADVTIKAAPHRVSRVTATKGLHIRRTGGASMRPLVVAGARPLPGFQLRYVAFLDQTWRERLTVPVLPYSVIAEQGARMYRGVSRERSAGSGTLAASQRGRCDATRSLSSAGAGS